MERPDLSSLCVGLPGVDLQGQLLRVLREIYPPEKEALGVLAIHLGRRPAKA